MTKPVTRYIRVPADVIIRDQLTGKPAGEVMSFRKLAFIAWLNDPRGIAGGPVAIARWSQVVAAFDSAREPGAIIEIRSEEAFAALAKIVEDPSPQVCTIPPLLAVQLGPLYAAVLEASTEHPLGSAAAASAGAS